MRDNEIFELLHRCQKNLQQIVLLENRPNSKDQVLVSTILVDHVKLEDYAFHIFQDTRRMIILSLVTLFFTIICFFS